MNGNLRPCIQIEMYHKMIGILDHLDHGPAGGQTAPPFCGRGILFFTSF